MATLDRKVLGEVVVSAAAWQGGILVLGIPIGLERLLRQHELPLHASPIAQLLLPAAASILAHTIPIAVLLAVGLTYGRMIRNREALLAEISGIPSARLSLPFLALGLGASAVAFWLLAWALPTARASSRAWLRQNVDVLLRAPPEDPVVFDLPDRDSRLLIAGAPPTTDSQTPHLFRDDFPGECVAQLWHAGDSGWPDEIIVLRDPRLRGGGLFASSGLLVRLRQSSPVDPPVPNEVLTFGRIDWPVDGLLQVPEDPSPGNLTWGALRSALTLPSPVPSRTDGGERARGTTERSRREMCDRAAAGFSPLLMAFAIWFLLDVFRPRWVWQSLALTMGFWLLVYCPLQMIGKMSAVNAALHGCGPWLPWAGTALILVLAAVPRRESSRNRCFPTIPIGSRP